ncbi:hypothetical protein [Segetibacter sp.]|jgi:hypothetical protein|nr:hypothetical protein [Segetibacter sp.]
MLPIKLRKNVASERMPRKSAFYDIGKRPSKYSSAVDYSTGSNGM